MPKTMTRKKKPVAKKKTMMKKKPMKGRVSKTSRKAVVRKAAKKVTKKLIKKATVKAKGSPVLGKVVHYYDRIGVAVVELNGSVAVGDMVLFRRGDQENMQVVTSLHIDHVAVPSAKKGQDVGMKVDRKFESGTLMLKP